jgi:hypothetical protein
MQTNRPRFHTLSPRNRSPGYNPRSGMFCLTEQLVFCETEILRYALFYKHHSYPSSIELPWLILIQKTSGLITLHTFSILTSDDSEEMQPFHRCKFAVYPCPRNYVPLGYARGPEMQRQFRLRAHSNTALLGSQSAGGYQLAHQIFSSDQCWSGRDLYWCVVLENPKFLKPKSASSS